MPITIVQTSTGATATASSLATTFANPVTNGNGVVALLGASSSAVLSSVTDGSGNTYFKRVDGLQVGLYAAIAYCGNVSGGFTTVTANWSASNVGWIVAYEVLGQVTDDVRNATGANNATQSPGSITTTGAERIVFAVDHAASSITAQPTGFTTDYSQGGAFMAAHNIFSAIQTGLVASFTASISVNYEACVCAFSSTINTPPTANFITPPIRFGPPIPGSPWMMQRPYLPPPPTRAPPPPVPDVIRTYTRPTYGPPVPGAPWSAKFGFPTTPGNPIPQPVVVPTPPIGPGRGKNAALLDRIGTEKDQRRVERFSDHLSFMWNSLVGQGIIRKVGIADFTIVAKAFTAVLDPTTTDDQTQGFVVGSMWLNTVSQAVWICLDNTQNAAVWKKVA